MALEIPDDSGEPNGACDPLDLVAADWLVRRDRGFTPGQEQEFARWLCADPSHAHAFGRLDETWRQLDAVPAASLPMPSASRRGWTWAASALAAAASVTIAILSLPPA